MGCSFSWVPHLSNQVVNLLVKQEVQILVSFAEIFCLPKLFLAVLLAISFTSADCFGFFLEGFLLFGQIVYIAERFYPSHFFLIN